MTAHTPARGRFTYTPEPPTVYYGQRLLHLPKTQAALLIMLASAELVSAEDLIATGIRTPNSLRAHLSKLRLRLPKHVRLVSAYGKGYRLIIP
jgi:DNA-binding response OmpR family regulator